MRQLIMIVVSALIAMPVYATWQVANPLQGTAKQKHVQPEIGNTSYPMDYVIHPRYVVHIEKGSLKNNVERIAQKYRWRVKWSVSPKTYQVLTQTEIGGSSFKMIMDQLLNNYSLKGSYNNRKRMVVISQQKS